MMLANQIAIGKASGLAHGFGLCAHMKVKMNVYGKFSAEEKKENGRTNQKGLDSIHSGQ